MPDSIEGSLFSCHVITTLIDSIVMTSFFLSFSFPTLSIDAIVENSKLRQQMSILEKRLMQYEAMCSGNHMYPESNSDMYSYPYGDSQEDPAEDDPTEDDVDENAAKFDLDLKGSESEPDDVSSSFTPRLAVGEPFMIERPKIIPKLDFSHLEKEASEVSKRIAYIVGEVDNWL